MPPKIKFLIDENIGSNVESFLIKAGYDAKRVVSGSKNGEVVHIALIEKRVLITHDIHFSNILMYPPNKYCGIIRVRIHPPSANKVIPALQGLLEKVAADGFNRKLFILEENGFRVK